MRTYDFSPLFRSTVGFDRLFDMLDNGTRPDWPPYNIQKVREDQYQISMALAGFDQNEIELIQEGNTLTVTGQKKTEANNEGMLHHGLAFRNFKHSTWPIM
jgi:molecular chaperone IbpA